MLKNMENEKITALNELIKYAEEIGKDSTICLDEYAATVHKIYKERPKVTLTADDIAERNAKVEEILSGLLER